MLQPTTKHRRVSHVTGAAITTIALLLGCIASTSAQQPQPAKSMAAPEVVSARLTDLEDAFWVCDYLATTRGVSDIGTCTTIYDALKERRFSGDFDKLVDWWRQNKVAQHQRVARMDRMVGSQVQ
jgi:hypothetical protein